MVVDGGTCGFLPRSGDAPRQLVRHYPVGTEGQERVPEAKWRPRNNLAYRRFSPCRSLPGVHLRERLEVAPHSEAATDSAVSIAAIRPSGNTPTAPGQGRSNGRVGLQAQLDEHSTQ